MNPDFGFENYIVSPAHYPTSTTTTTMTTTGTNIGSVGPKMGPHTVTDYLDVPTPPLDAHTGVFELYGQPSSPESCLSRSPRSPAAAMAAALTEKVNTLPESFLPEFHQYSKETYENGPKKKKRTSTKAEAESATVLEHNDLVANRYGPEDPVSIAEARRQIHIQSEQKRRAQIRDGFDELRQHLPGCTNKKMSKAALLHRTVQHIQHLKSSQDILLAELKRLAMENEQLRKYQNSVLHKQTLERMYPLGM